MKVLLTDDDRLSRRVIRHILATEFACAVAEASDGLEALEALRAEAFDLLILDLQMPVMDGHQTMHALRESNDSRWRDLPVVILSADCTEETVREVAGLRVVGYLAKPVVRDRLVERLRRILRDLAGGAGPGVPSDAGSTLLLVDGDESFRQVFLRAVGTHCPVLTAESGVQGLRVCQEGRPGVVFIGSTLGVLNEQLLVKRLRSLARACPRLVAVVSDAAERSVRADYDAAIVRSVLPEVIAEQVEVVTRAPVVAAPLAEGVG